MDQQMHLKVKQYSMREAFGDRFPDTIKVTGFEKSDCPFVPDRDPDWVWDRNVLRDLVIWWQDGGKDPALLFGHTGTGKSGAAKNFCAALNIPMYEKTIVRTTEFEELVTRVDLAGGSTIPSFSWLPLAMGAEGYPGIFCPNEIDRADPGMLVGLYEVLEGRPLTVSIGGLDVVKPSQFFRVLATSNTNLMGDPHGLYVSATQQDLAIVDRFWKIRVPYMDAQTEKDLLAKIVPQIAGTPTGRKLTDAMVEVANEIRLAFMGESDANQALPLTMSTRSLVRWARMSWLYRGAASQGQSPVLMAMDRALVNAADGHPGVRRAIEEIVKGKLGESPGV